MLIGNIKHDATIAEIRLSCVSFVPHSRIFLVGGPSISEIEQCLKNSTDPRKCRCRVPFFHQSSRTRVLHEDMLVDLFVFCGILASFLDWISLSVPVVIPRPESSLSVNKQVGRKILGAKSGIVNRLPVVCTRKWRFKIVFRKLNCSTATKAALVWIINGSTSDSESLDTAWLFRLFLAFTSYR